jgi:hypothetical protein
LIEGSSETQARVSPPPLRTAGGADALRVHLGHGHYDPCKLRGIEVDLTEGQLLRGVVEPTDNVAAEGASLHGAEVLGEPGLATAIERGNRETLRDPGELVKPVSRAAAVTVENEDGGELSLRAFRAEKFGVNARPTHPREEEVEALGSVGLEGSGPQFHLRVEGAHLGKGAIPKGIHVLRAGIDSVVLFQFGERFIDEGHGRGFKNSLAPMTNRFLIPSGARARQIF